MVFSAFALEENSKKSNLGGFLNDLIGWRKGQTLKQLLHAMLQKNQ